tara:strand:- start:309 stop:509 length:201 start_codon:yes stop_codon:yes gene_type:complete
MNPLTKNSFRLLLLRFLEPVKKHPVPYNKKSDNYFADEADLGTASLFGKRRDLRSGLSCFFLIRPR